jgi:hypothetical protein
MSSNFPPVKSFNYSVLNMTTSTVLQPESYNYIYSKITAPANLTLPALTYMVDGSPILVSNPTAFTLTVLLADGVTTLATVAAGQTVELYADKQSSPNAWRITSGPESITAGVSGPGSSTNNAVALWNGTTGQVLKNSVILVDGSNNITGAASITLATTGGTPSALNYYEEFPLTGNTFSGAFTAPQACVIAITRVGRDVRILVPDVKGAAAAAVATATVAIPARFLPPTASAGSAGYITGGLFVQNGATTATNGQVAGQWTLNTTTGILVIGASSATGPAAFGAANNNGWNMFSVGWSV